MVKSADKEKRVDGKNSKPFKKGDKPRHPAKADKPAEPTNTEGIDQVAKNKKIQKPATGPNELQSHYQRIILNIKKKKVNKELLNKSIYDFLQYYQKNSANLTNKALGAKVLQLCLKYGNTSHKETIVLLLLKHDFVSLCSSIYGGFIISKVFRYCDKVDSIKVVKDFFRKNFRDLLKKKENLVALNAYVTSMDEKTGLNYLEKELSTAKLNEFYFHEFIQYVDSKPSVMKLGLVYYLINHYFDTIGEEQRGLLLQLILKHVDEAINKSEHKYFVILCILKIFMNVNFKSKKDIIKKFLKDQYLEYYTKHSGFIYLLIGLMKKISDQKVTNITILKSLRAQFDSFFNNVEIAKLVELLFSDEIADKLQKDKFFRCNQAVKKVLEIESIDSDPIFRANVLHIRKELASDSELLNFLSFDQLKAKSSENTAFSLLYSALLEQICRGKLKRRKHERTHQ